MYLAIPQIFFPSFRLCNFCGQLPKVKLNQNKLIMSDTSKLSTEGLGLDAPPEGTLQKFSRKTRDSPLMVAGLSSFFIIAAYGIYSFRNRGKLSASNYLMQLRVTAQGAVIGCLTLGVMKSIYDHLSKKDKES